MTAANGCDSTITINITELPLNSQNYNPTICNGDTVIVNGNVYSSATTLTGTEIMTAASGCDSIVMVNINELQPFTDQVIASLCNVDSYTK